MEYEQNESAQFLSHAFLNDGRLRKLRKDFILRVSHINYPIYREMNKTATLLTNREIEVLAYVARGKSNSEIAIALHLSKHTISNHRKNMLSSSRCATTAELVRIAMLEKLI